MAIPIPNIKFDFSNSARSAANSAASIGQAGSIFANMVKQRQQKEALEQAKINSSILRNQNQQRIDATNKNRLQQALQFDRQQDFVESAPERLLAQQEAERERVRQINKQKYGVINNVLGKAKEDFNIDPNNEQAILSDPRVASLPVEQQQQILSDIRQNIQSNIPLYADPAQLENQIRQDAQSKGYNPEDIEGLVQLGLRQFKTMDRDTAKLILDRDTAKQKNLATILKGSGSGSGGVLGGGSRGRSGTVTDENIRQNIDHTNEYIESVGGDLGEPSWPVKVAEFFNPLNETDLTKVNITPILTAMGEAGVREPSAIKALEGLGYLRDGEWQTGLFNWFDDKPSGLKLLKPENAEKFKELLDTATALQNSNRRDTSGVPSLEERRSIFSDSTRQSDELTNKIISSLTRSQKSASDRLPIIMKYLEERTGTKLSNSALPTKAQKQAVKAQFINVNEEEEQTPQVTPNVSSSAVNTPILTKNETRYKNQLENAISKAQDPNRKTRLQELLKEFLETR